MCYVCEEDARKRGSEAGCAAANAWREENSEKIKRAKERQMLSDSRLSYGLLPTMESYLMYMLWFLCASSDSYGIFHHPCVKVVIVLEKDEGVDVW